MPGYRIPPPEAPVGPYFPAGFRLATGATAGETLHPAARFLFAGETIAVPSTPPHADYSRGADPFADLAAWAANPGPIAGPPLVWIAAPERRTGLRIAPDGRSFQAGGAAIDRARLAGRPRRNGFAHHRRRGRAVETPEPHDPRPRATGARTAGRSRTSAPRSARERPGDEGPADPVGGRPRSRRGTCISTAGEAGEDRRRLPRDRHPLDRAGL